MVFINTENLIAWAQMGTKGMSTLLYSTLLYSTQCPPPSHFYFMSPVRPPLRISNGIALRKTVKYEISGNFPLTWSLKIGWLFQFI